MLLNVYTGAAAVTLSRISTLGAFCACRVFGAFGVGAAGVLEGVGSLGSIGVLGSVGVLRILRVVGVLEAVGTCVGCRALLGFGSDWRVDGSSCRGRTRALCSLFNSSRGVLLQSCLCGLRRHINIYDYQRRSIRGGSLRCAFL